ncbi:MAG: glycosyl hydrolase [Clostridiaceae bacterium]|nr:glycosyl hydrolase [Clostridiaceae bacterium]
MSFIKGVDISVQNEIEQLGAKYFKNGKEFDVIEILKDFNINAVRLRLWYDPYDENNRPYGGGTNDLPVTIKIAERAKSKNMQFLLDFHYSDFWADPEIQKKPKAWEDLSGEALEEAVYNYTLETIKELSRNGVMPDMVQIGNEITNGFLWPDGKFDNVETMTKLLSKGVCAVKDFNPDIKTVIHLDNGGNNKLYREWFDKVSPNLNFDIIGLSYYPFWHGTLEELSHNMNDISSRYNKDVMIVETAFPFTIEKAENQTGIFTQEHEKIVPYKANEQGQSQFMHDLMKVIKAVDNNRGLGFFYWEPTWINIGKAYWSKEPGIRYLNKEVSLANVWYNLALFDYKGNALPALEVIRDF